MSISNRLMISISPLNVFGDWFGTNIYKYDYDTGNFRLNPISIVVNLFVLCLLTNLIVYDVNYNTNTDESLTRATGMFDLFSGTIIGIVSNIVNVVTLRKYEKFVSILSKIDERFRSYHEQFSIVNDVRYNNLIVAGIIAILIEFSATFFTDYFVFVKDESYTYLFISYFPIVRNGIVKLYYVVFVRLVLDRFKAIEKSLIKLQLNVEQRNVTVGEYSLLLSLNFGPQMETILEISF